MPKKINKKPPSRAIRRRKVQGKVTAKPKKSLFRRALNMGGSILSSVSTGAARAAGVVGWAPRSTWLDESRGSYQGKPTKVFRGSQTAMYIKRDGSQDALATLNAATTEVSLIPLHPSNVFVSGSTVFNDAITYTEYRFKKLKIHYDSRATTATVGSFLLGYFADGAMQSSDVGSNQALFYALNGSVSVPIWAGGDVTDFTPSLDGDWHYIDQDNTSDASRRQSYQGGIAAIWDTIPADGYWGYLVFDFELELRNPRPNIDIALLRKKRLALELGQCYECGHDVKSFERKIPVPGGLPDEKKKFMSGFEPPPLLVQIAGTDPGASIDVKVTNSSLDIKGDVKVTNSLLNVSISDNDAKNPLYVNPSDDSPPFPIDGTVQIIGQDIGSGIVYGEPLVMVVSGIDVVDGSLGVSVKGQYYDAKYNIGGGLVVKGGVGDEIPVRVQASNPSLSDGYQFPVSDDGTSGPPLSVLVVNAGASEAVPVDVTPSPSHSSSSISSSPELISLSDDLPSIIPVLRREHNVRWGGSVRPLRAAVKPESLLSGKVPK